MIVFVFTSLIAGMFSVLAPCVLPVLPVILSASMTHTYYRSVLIIVSCIGSIFLFTILLKASSLFIGVPTHVWTWIWWLIIIAYGLILIAPDFWTRLRLFLWIDRIHLYKWSSTFLGDILLGVSLGPVFTTCSLTYVIIIATIFPVSIRWWIIYTFAYCIGFGVMLILIMIMGRWLIRRMSNRIDPYSIGHKLVGVLLIIMGILIVTGYIKHIQAYLVSHGVGDWMMFEKSLIDQTLYSWDIDI